MQKQLWMRRLAGWLLRYCDGSRFSNKAYSGPAEAAITARAEMLEDAILLSGGHPRSPIQQGLGPTPRRLISVALITIKEQARRSDRRQSPCRRVRRGTQNIVKMTSGRQQRSGHSLRTRGVGDFNGDSRTTRCRRIAAATASALCSATATARSAPPRISPAANTQPFAIKTGSSTSDQLPRYCDRRFRRPERDLHRRQRQRHLCTRPGGALG